MRLGLTKTDGLLRYPLTQAAGAEAKALSVAGITDGSQRVTWTVFLR